MKPIDIEKYDEAFEELQRQVTHWRNAHQVEQERVAIAMTDCEKLEWSLCKQADKIKRLAEALKVYANRESWTEYSGSLKRHWYWRDGTDGRMVAVAALEGLKETPGV